MDVGCHTLDIIDFIVGPLQDVRGVAVNSGATPYAVEDGVSISASFGVGGTASMSWSFAAPPDAAEDQIVIRGTRGEMSLSTFGADGIDLRILAADDSAGKPEATGDWINAARSTTLSTTREEFTPPQHAHQPLVQLVVDELRGVGTCPSKADNALRCASVLDAALDSYYGGRADAFWSREHEWPGRSP